MTEARRLNDEGIRQLDALLAAVRVGGDADFHALRDDPLLTESLDVRIDVEPQPFESRYELGAYLYRAVGGASVDGDRGVWSWLAVAWVDILAPLRPDQTRRVGERARWVLAAEDYRRYYRHLLAGPYAIYKAHSDDPQRATALLSTPVDRPGEVVEQFASRQEIVTNPGLVGLITDLYVDPSTGRIRKGAAGKGPGSARRLADILLQLDMTWDIYGMTAEDIGSLLPEEFGKFRAA